MSLEPRKGTQGREMTRKTGIASALALALACAFFAPVSLALAGNPLLSGYGGPGAGEQAIIGGTFLNGPPGGAPGGVSSGASHGESRGGSGESLSAGAPGSTREWLGTVGSSSSTARSRRAQSGPTAARAFTYPSSLRVASSPSPLGISSADVLWLILIITVLALTGVLTRRLGRLQR